MGRAAEDRALTHDGVVELSRKGMAHFPDGDERLVAFLTDDGELFLERQQKHCPMCSWELLGSSEGFAEMELSSEETGELVDYIAADLIAAANR